MKVGLTGIGFIAFVVGIFLIAAAIGEPPGSAAAALYWLFGVGGVVGGPIAAVSGIVLTIAEGAGRKRSTLKSRTRPAPVRRRPSRRRRWP